MKKFLSQKMVLLIFSSFLFTSLNAQDIASQFEAKGEKYFTFRTVSDIEMTKLSGIISIDKIVGDSIIANASLKEFMAFLEFGIEYNFLPHPAEQITDIAKGYDEIKGLSDWNFYPTYEGYVALMNDFETDFPALCEVHNIGTLASGRQLLVARISKDVGEVNEKPRFLYTSSIHGDELTGFVNSLQMIDYLLSNYGSNPYVTRLVDSIDIWINPNANPDGTYKGGNHTVSGAVRRNANNVDLNRNYPDPVAGPNPDGNAWQPETVFFMDFAEQYKFNISANMHGGAEVCNYPWDTWQQLSADNAWWVYTMREYADTVHAFSPPPYFRGFDSGITNGYAWYTITGGRQDYMNYFHQCREFTLELTNTKTPPASQLPTFWNYNYRSYFNYMEQSLYGIRGTVTNSVTGAPIRARVEIIGHDNNNSFVYSSAEAGNYHRFLFAGTYSLTFSAPCYESITFPNVSVSNREVTWQNVEMLALPLLADFEASATTISPGQQTTFSDASCGNITSRSWYFDGGNPMVSTAQNPVITYQNAGVYDVMLVVSSSTGTDTIIKHNYIKVAPSFNIANGTHTTCLANFYDSGGPNGNYSSNENYTLTFLPASSGAKIKVDFSFFDVEANANCAYDWLKIYDGANTSATLMGTWCGNNSPGLITATNAGGALTFSFKSDNSVNNAGWKAFIECEPLAVQPVADFQASVTHITEGDTIIFSNLSSGFPTNHLWHFDGGTPATSTLKNPMVIYDTPGLYSVTLEVSNNQGSDTKTIQNYIQVDEGVGMARFNSRLSLKVYPNPVTNGILQIESSNDLGNVELFSLMGQKIIHLEVDSPRIFIDVSSVTEGIYLLKVQNTLGVAVMKIYIL
ncbi:MAG: PKD domain-containing protein [Bacteroidales bacterium]|nr:PKD domain-containing protein [Bacteroidales bacterium]